MGGIGISYSSPRRGEVDAQSAAGEGGFGIAPKSDKDRSEHTIQVVRHVGIGETKDAVASIFQGPGSSCIVGLAPGMGIAVQFDDEALRPRSEVDDVRRKHDLPLELHAEPVRAKPVPQAAFGLGEVGAETFGPVPGCDMPFQTPPSPSPLPLKGERGIGVRHALTPFESVQSVNA